eukprot:34922-Prymnesium_polylepis.1
MVTARHDRLGQAVGQREALHLAHPRVLRGVRRHCQREPLRTLRLRGPAARGAVLLRLPDRDGEHPLGDVQVRAPCLKASRAARSHCARPAVTRRRSLPHLAARLRAQLAHRPVHQGPGGAQPATPRDRDGAVRRQEGQLGAQVDWRRVAVRRAARG